MLWLNKIVDQVIDRFPDGVILVESGGSPSGTYHIGHMRELIICDAIKLELQRRGRQAKHIYFVDDLDALRKVPANVNADFKRYLGQPLCDVPAPDASNQSYADFFLTGLKNSCQSLGVDVEFIRAHEKYRSGFFVPAIERCLEQIPQIRQLLETVSNRQLAEDWTPVQIMEDGRLKNRKFLGIDTTTKTLRYQSESAKEQTISYATGAVKLDWRLDWPGRWWLLKVQIEPFGREHASAGGSYDSALRLMEIVYQATPPLPVPYDSIHMVGDTKKMSASKGTALSATDGLQILPAEVLRFFILRAPLNRPLIFDPVQGVVKLMDDFAALIADPARSESDQQLLEISSLGVANKTISRVPFSHLVASYQASLKQPDRTLEVISRTEYASIVKQDAAIIGRELKYIDVWLKQWAPDELKFDLRDQIKTSDVTETERQFLSKLAAKISEAPENADGAWFHDAIYGLAAEVKMPVKDLFAVLYQVLIAKSNGPRAGYFLSILPRDWLIRRLRLEAA